MVEVALAGGEMLAAAVTRKAVDELGLGCRRSRLLPSQVRLDR